MSDIHNEPERGAELAGEVSSHVREGKPGRASQAFQKGWRDAVPELPFRFSVILVRPDRDTVERLHRKLRAKEEVNLKLVREDDSTVQVSFVDDDSRVGTLPVNDARLLFELEADDDLYVPHPMEIRYEPNGKLHYVAIELVRPELRYCSACGEPHSGPNINCEECRSKRRKLGEERFEAPPVHFHEALDTLSRDESHSDDPDF